jgi:hypothetical protein
MSCDSTTYTAVNECYRGGVLLPVTETNITQKVSLDCAGVQIGFDIEVCLLDIDVEILSLISKLYLQ